MASAHAPPPVPQREVPPRHRDGAETLIIRHEVGIRQPVEECAHANNWLTSTSNCSVAHTIS
eukprot:14444514-Alexandrium_andersonii.AAC.1